MLIVLSTFVYCCGVVGAVNLASEDDDFTQAEAVALGILWPLMLPLFGALHLVGWDEP